MRTSTLLVKHDKLILYWIVVNTSQLYIIDFVVTDIDYILVMVV